MGMDLPHEAKRLKLESDAIQNGRSGEYLPRDLSSRILNMAAALNMEDMLRRSFMSIANIGGIIDPRNFSLSSWTTVVSMFVEDLRKLLYRHGALISGSYAVKAFLGNDAWIEGDLDIFVEYENTEKFTKDFRQLMESIFVCPNTFRIEILEDDDSDVRHGIELLDTHVVNISFYDRYIDDGGSYRVSIGGVLLCEKMNCSPFKVQIIGLKVGEEHMIFPKKDPTLGDMLLDLFDTSVCSSYYDGRTFKAWNPFVAIRKVSYIRPHPVRFGTNRSFMREYRKTIGKTPVLNRPYQFGVSANDHIYEGGDGSKLPHLTAVAVDDWIIRNGLPGTTEAQSLEARINKYLERGFALCLSTPFATSSHPLEDDRYQSNNTRRFLTKSSGVLNRMCALNAHLRLSHNLFHTHLEEYDVWNRILEHVTGYKLIQFLLGTELDTPAPSGPISVSEFVKMVHMKEPVRTGDQSNWITGHQFLSPFSITCADMTVLLLSQADECT